MLLVALYVFVKGEDFLYRLLHICIYICVQLLYTHVLLNYLSQDMVQRSRYVRLFTHDISFFKVKLIYLKMTFV